MVGGLLLPAAGAALGCAAGGIAFGGRSGRPAFPDAAAVEAGARARAEFEKARRPYGAGDETAAEPAAELAARVEEVGRGAVRDHFGEHYGEHFGEDYPAVALPPEATGGAGGGGGPAAGPEGWRFVVTDDAAPEAFLFADGSVFLTRGALAVLGGERSLGELFRGAAARYADRSFRGADGSLLPQPIPVPLPREGSPGADSATPGAAAASPGESGDEPWIALLDGLAYGEPPERGGARGRDLYLPRAGLRLRAPPGYLFAPGAEGRHRAARGLRPDLVVEELEPGDADALPAPVSETVGETIGETVGATVETRVETTVETRVGTDGVFHAEGAREQRRRLRELAGKILERAGERPVEFVEAVRGRGVRGAAARLGGRRADAGRGPAGPAGPIGAARGYLALLDAPRGLVEVRFDCGRRPLAACENSFMAMLRSAAPYRSGAAPGWLRLRAARVPRPGSALGALEAIGALEALEAFARGGESDVPVFVLRELNRGRLDRPAAPGDLLLVARREPAPSGGPGAGNPAPAPAPAKAQAPESASGRRPRR